MKKKSEEPTNPPRRILGIDPGLGSTGVGVIEQTASGWRLLASGVVTSAATTPTPARLKKIYKMVQQMIREYTPHCIAVEGIFFAKNVRSAVQMAHGRGVALLAAAELDIPVHEISALEIKQSVVGKGRASKDQVAKMVILLLGLSQAPKTDHESDAIACALAWAYREKHTLLVESQAVANKQDTNKSLLLLRRSSKGRSRGWKA